ncbi:MAG: hypothetical protein IPL46_12820 [Saprospiraceae bacterium]|nr:hypothetical protein [Saprospiraceae bacterium]
MFRFITLLFLLLLVTAGEITAQVTDELLRQQLVERGIDEGLFRKKLQERGVVY